MPFQGFPLSKLRTLKKKGNKKNQGFRVFSSRRAAKGRRRKMFSQKESAGIRSRIRTCWLCCSAPQCSVRTKSSTFRGREHSTGKQAKYFCVKLLSESPAQKSNSCGGRVGELPGQARCGKISCCAPRQIIPQLSIVLSA